MLAWPARRCFRVLIVACGSTDRTPADQAAQKQAQAVGHISPGRAATTLGIVPSNSDGQQPSGAGCPESVHGRRCVGERPPGQARELSVPAWR
jgi:hypothetical protein